MRAHLVQDDAIAGQAVDVVEVGVGIEVGVALLQERPAAPLVGADLVTNFT